MGFGWMRSDNATERENSLGSEKEDGIHGEMMETWVRGWLGSWVVWRRELGAHYTITGMEDVRQTRVSEARLWVRF